MGQPMVLQLHVLVALLNSANLFSMTAYAIFNGPFTYPKGFQQNQLLSTDDQDK
jgi:hypothetical protein